MAFDLAVVIQTLCRPTMSRALNSIFKQTHKGPIQVMIGVDQGLDDAALRRYIDRYCPSHVVCTIINVGYSTYTGNGGVHSAIYGGSLRTSLSFLANSTYVAYLDDDDWWDPGHVADMLVALKQADWAFSLRNFINPANAEVIVQDQWESLGPGKGIFAERFGGFVCPLCLGLNKINLAPLLHLWSFAMFPAGDGEDRMLLKGLFQLKARCAATNRASAMYTINPNDPLHPERLRWFAQSGYDITRIPLQGEKRPV